MAQSKVAWSYSSLDMFKLCPHKYYRLKVKKDVVEPPQEHLRFGLDVHKVAEDYIRDGTPIPPKYSTLLASLERIRAMKGDKLCEQRLGLTRDLQPCKLQNKQVCQVRRHQAVGDLIVSFI
jgi:hypothetical protein